MILGVEMTGARFKFAVNNHDSTELCPTSNAFWTDHLEPVNKDPKFPKVPRSTGPRTTPEYRALHNIARRIRPILRASLVKGLTDFRKNINLHDLAEAISNADAAEAFNLVPWGEFEGAVEGLDKAMLEGVTESAEKSKFLFQKSIQSLVPSLDPDVVFDSSNPDISKWIDDHLGEMIQNVKENTQKSIQNVIRIGLDQGIPPRDSAKLISQMVGLNDKQAQAVINRRLSLQKLGVKGRRLDSLIELYSKKLLKHRGETIARTEAMTANNRGQMEVVNQNANAGLFDRTTAKKEWVVTPYDRVCPICKPLAGKQVLLDQDFKLRNGGSVSLPPAHPNCNCSWILVLPKAK